MVGTMKGQKIKIFFDDGTKISWREGIVTQEDEFSITLDNKEGIPKGRIVRLEVLENGK
jgi:hypothetical protein